MTTDMSAFKMVQLEAAGPGVFLLFRNSDFRVLFNEFGPNYLHLVELGLSRADIGVVEVCLAASAKRDNKPIKINLDDIEAITMADLCDKILDAFTLSNSGRTYREQVAWVTEIQEKAINDAAKRQNPTIDPANISGDSSETLVGSESETPTSGS